MTEGISQLVRISFKKDPDRKQNMPPLKADRGSHWSSVKTLFHNKIDQVS